MHKPTPEFAARLDRLVAACRGSASLQRLGADIARLSDFFGSDRAQRKADYMADPALRGAYLSFFLPQYAAKIALLLDQFRTEGLMALPERPRVLDLGAGPLTGLSGVWLHTGALGESVALDLARRVMDVGKQILDTVAPGQPVRLATQSVTQRPLPGGTYDLIIVAHVLNELGDPRRARPMRVAMVKALLDALAPGGRLLIVEPATRVHGRSLMAVRDEMVHSAAVLSPCRGTNSCPLLRQPSDWCHGDLLWERPAPFLELERASGLRKDVLKESHLLLGRRGEATVKTTGLRIIGGLMTGPDGVERRYACGSRGLEVLVGEPRLSPAARDRPRHALLDPVPVAVERTAHAPVGDVKARGVTTPSRVRRPPAAPRGSYPVGQTRRGPGNPRRR